MRALVKVSAVVAIALWLNASIVIAQAPPSSATKPPSAVTLPPTTFRPSPQIKPNSDPQDGKVILKSFDKLHPLARGHKSESVTKNGKKEIKELPLAETKKNLDAKKLDQQKREATVKADQRMDAAALELILGIGSSGVTISAAALSFAGGQSGAQAGAVDLRQKALEGKLADELTRDFGPSGVSPHEINQIVNVIGQGGKEGNAVALSITVANAELAVGNAAGSRQHLDHAKQLASNQPAVGVQGAGIAGGAIGRSGDAPIVGGPPMPSPTMSAEEAERQETHRRIEEKKHEEAVAWGRGATEAAYAVVARIVQVVVGSVIAIYSSGEAGGGASTAQGGSITNTQGIIDQINTKPQDSTKKTQDPTPSPEKK